MIAFALCAFLLTFFIGFIWFACDNAPRHGWLDEKEPK